MDISIPKILHYIKPNLLIIEKLKGKTLKDSLNQSEVIDSPTVIDLVSEILKIYKVTEVNENPILEISDNKIILTDNHLNKKTIYSSVHENTIGKLQKVIQQKQNLVHGDLKLNNIFLDKNKIKLIDPHLHFSNPFMDLGWFTIMAYIYAISRGKRDIVYNFLTNFYTIYREKTGLNVKVVEEPSLILGVMQINNLLSRERRPNFEWLGDEMLDMYNLQSNLSLLYKTIINDGKILNLDQLFLQ